MGGYVFQCCDFDPFARERIGDIWADPVEGETLSIRGSQILLQRLLDEASANHWRDG